MANLVQKEAGIETIVHISGRDRNLIGIQSALMGMAIDGIKNILAVTGDPPSKGDEEKVTGVFDLNSYEIIKLIARLNEGENYYGENINKKTAFTIGAAFNPNTVKIEVQVNRLRKKIDSGIHFVQTQPVFSIEKVNEVIECTRGINIPFFLGILPLVSSRNAEFLHNEFPGITIPDPIRKRMFDAGDGGIEEGIEIAWEIIDYSLEQFAGIYIMPPFNKFAIAAELVRRINSKING
jgi:methionine synthase / methylenetetrahydrofolate reductase(NADPH)